MNAQKVKLFNNKGVTDMTTNKNEQNKHSILDFVCKKRNSHVEVFPLRKGCSDDFVKRIQGVALSKRAVRDLRRAQLDENL